MTITQAREAATTESGRHIIAYITECIQLRKQALAEADAECMALQAVLDNLLAEQGERIKHNGGYV